MHTIQQRVEALRIASSNLDHQPVNLNPGFKTEAKTREELLNQLEKGQPLETQTQTPSGGNLVAGMSFQLPPQFPSSIPGLPDTGTLWCMLQHQANTVLGPNNPLNNLTNLAGGGGFGTSLPSLSGLPSLSDIGINSALTAVQGQFQGFNTEGYLDISKDLGLDYNFQAAADGTLSAEIEAEATVPILILGNNKSTTVPRITVGHQVRMCHCHPEFTALHSLKMSMPVANGKGMAKVRVKQSSCVGSNPGLSLEIGGKRKQIETRNGTANGTNRKSNNSTTSDDDGDNGMQQTPLILNDNTNMSDNKNKNSPTMTTLTQPPPCRIPQIKLDIDPLIPSNTTTLISDVLSSTVPRHIGVHWHQTWSSALRTAVVYRSRSRRLQVDARAKIMPTMLVSAGAVLDSTHRTVHKALAKVLWKPCNNNGTQATGARHAVQIESKFAKESGIHHVIKVRRRPKQKDGLEASVSINFAQENIRRPALQFDFYLPT